VEVEATLSGTLARVLAEEGRILKPGDPLAVIAEPDEPRDAAAIDRALVELNG
jgi:pyruvate/2-oxoglutarate dehydrogenase complex dihydrolipoamide acyltransferase (E2) component